MGLGGGGVEVTIWVLVFVEREEDVPVLEGLVGLSIAKALLGNACWHVTLLPNKPNTPLLISLHPFNDEVFPLHDATKKNCASRPGGRGFSTVKRHSAFQHGPVQPGGQFEAVRVGTGCWMLQFMGPSSFWSLPGVSKS